MSKGVSEQVPVEAKGIWTRENIVLYFTKAKQRKTISKNKGSFRQIRPNVNVLKNSKFLLPSGCASADVGKLAEPHYQLSVSFFFLHLLISAYCR